MTDKEIIVNTSLVLAYNKTSEELYILCSAVIKTAEEKYKDGDGMVLVAKACTSDIWPLQDFVQASHYLRGEMINDDEGRYDYVMWYQLREFQILAVHNADYELFSYETYLSEQ